MNEEADRTPIRSFGLQWESALTNGYVHDGWVDSITHPNGFRDTTIAIAPPWYWDVKDAPLPDGVSHEAVSRMRLIFRFKDVAEFTISLEGDYWRQQDGWRETVEGDEIASNEQLTYESQLTSPLVSRQTIYLWSEIDKDTDGMRAAEDAHGGPFRSVSMRLTSPCTLRAVFRDCECTPTDWVAYDAWSDYPFIAEGVSVPPLRTSPLITEGRYVFDHPRRVCTTRITFRPGFGSDEETLYLCDRCLDEWLDDYARGCSIPRCRSGAGELPSAHGSARSWERGRYPAQKCWCECKRRVP